MTPITYRLLTVKDAALFRKVRLRACREEPDAFLEAYEEIAKISVTGSRRYFKNGWISGAFNAEALVGITGLYRHKGIKVQHKGTLWGVYVAPEARGRGIARHLIKMVLNEAAHAGLELVHLTTNVKTPLTIELYKSLGFEPWGVEKHIMKLPDHYVDDVVMTKYLN